MNLNREKEFKEIYYGINEDDSKKSYQLIEWIDKHYIAKNKIKKILDSEYYFEYNGDVEILIEDIKNKLNIK